MQQLRIKTTLRLYEWLQIYHSMNKSRIGPTFLTRFRLFPFPIFPVIVMGT